jgi:hypothetical protein
MSAELLPEREAARRCQRRPELDAGLRRGCGDLRSEERLHLGAMEPPQRAEALADHGRARLDEERRPAHRGDKLEERTALLYQCLDPNSGGTALGQRPERGEHPLRLLLGSGLKQVFEVPEVVEDEAPRDTRPLGQALGGGLELSILKQGEERFDDRSAGASAPGAAAILFSKLWERSPRRHPCNLTSCTKSATKKFRTANAAAGARRTLRPLTSLVAAVVAGARLTSIARAADEEALKLADPNHGDGRIAPMPVEALTGRSQAPKYSNCG